jgi:hypothetical protein
MKTATIFVAFSLSLAFPHSMQGDEIPLPVRAAFEMHCSKCHGKGGNVEGEVNLVELKSGDDLRARPRLLQELVRVLKDGQMPPEDEPLVPPATRDEMITHLQATLQQVLKTIPFEVTPIRRMNRFQYNNAVVDLLELDRDIFQLNERLLRRREDYFRPQTRKMPAEVRVSSRPLSKDIDNQRPEGFRGVAPFPQDKRAEHGFDNRADHLSLSPLLMESFLQLSQTIVESPDLNPRECRSWDRIFSAPGQTARIVDGRYEGEAENQIRLVGKQTGRPAAQDMQGFGSAWSGNSQLFWLCPEPGAELTLSFEATEAGTGLRFGFTQAPDYGRFDVYLDDVKVGETVDLFAPKVQITKVTFADVKLNVGPHSLRFNCVDKNSQSVKHFFGLDYIDVTGRKKTPKTDDVANRTDAEVIRLRIAKLLRHAFRRPVNADTLNRFTKFADEQLAAGASFEDTMRTVVGAILGMPEFLYFYETGKTSKTKVATDDVAGRERVDEFELASRLAQFFWSSIPDDTLLDLAETGTLSDPTVLAAQIDRMLDDKRSSRFCDNFPVQWLQLDRLITSIPDPKMFPYFYYSGYRTSMHMMSEPLLLFETVYIEDRSIMDLVAPNFTWQSDMLRQNYEGLARSGQDVNVQLFKRVPLDDPRRGGVITSAAIMTMTSSPTRTQPITRGAWVNAVIFNDPPEPPPADVPPLPEGNAEELAKLTIRERLAAHRQRADCAGCHDQIDPFGFALENFGPTGVWRDKYPNGRQVDVGGVLFNKHKFSTFDQFKSLLVQEKQRFIRGFAAHLLSYALGRELGPADSPALDGIAAKAMTGKDQMRAVLKSIAMSDPFLHKNTQPK